MYYHQICVDCNAHHRPGDLPQLVSIDNAWRHCIKLLPDRPQPHSLQSSNQAWAREYRTHTPPTQVHVLSRSAGMQRYCVHRWLLHSGDSDAFSVQWVRENNNLDSHPEAPPFRWGHRAQRPKPIQSARVSFYLSLAATKLFWFSQYHLLRSWLLDWSFFGTPIPGYRSAVHETDALPIGWTAVSAFGAQRFNQTLRSVMYYQ